MTISQGESDSDVSVHAPRMTLGDFGDSTGLGLILISYYSLYTVSVEALVYSVTVHEQLSHDHRFPASYAAEGTAPPLVY